MPEHQPVATAEPAAPDRDQWFEETEELPHRPRRRLLGAMAGGNPLALALLAVLLIACGFIGGVLVEKGEGSSTGSSAAGASGLAARFRALRGAGAGTGSTGSGSTGGSSSLGAAGFTRPTAGTVAYLDGSTLYVTNAEGNTVKVSTSAATSVTKTVKSSVGAVHPGETVTVVGSTGASGSVSAESISVGASGAGGALAALFGGGRGGGASSGGAKSSGGSEPELFGKGG
ncbi:MAG TPA: hypothetical protein VGY13_03080 [Solirubrobacteraceae bacterium]|jgi:hypothetical protein|nr:hypothetical protein [Solirubrobacteraceae bacterium]